MVRTFSEIPNHDEVQFTLVGLAAAISFQRCLAHIELVHKKLPETYTKPFIRPMLESDWLEYLMKAKRQYGEAFWYLEKPCVVLANGIYLGDDDDLLEFLSLKFKLKLKRNYQCLATRGVLDLYEKFLQLGLYADYVPKTCRNFIKKCNSVRNGYSGKQIHRVMANGWIQFGDYELKSKSRSCENYKIPHNRRGVLSMCNNGRHTDNTTQFFVCLDATLWMDYKYVAFGQLIQGESVLAELEALETFYEYPANVIVRISKAGEITIEDMIAAKYIERTEKFIDKREAFGSEIILDPKDTPSILIESHYGKGYYWYEVDNRSYKMKNLRKDLITPEPSFVPCSVEEEEEEEPDVDYYTFLREFYTSLYASYAQEEGEEGEEGQENAMSIKHDTHEIISDDRLIYNYIETGG